MQKSVFYRKTGRVITHPAQKLALKPWEIERNNEILTAEFLEDTRGKSMYRRNSQEIDSRLNAVGDTAEVATGYQIAIDTLTWITRQISEQKFYTVAPADYMPVMVGTGSYAQSLLFNREYYTGDSFESGLLNQAQDNARLSVVDAQVDGVQQKTRFWAKAINWNIIEVNQALIANNWDPIAARMRSRKKNWDIGIQETAFYGLVTDNTNFPGLLTNPNVNTDTAIITKYISSMSAAELLAFLQAFIPRYFTTNTNSTAMPDTFIMPYVDWLACSQVFVQTALGPYPINLLQYLQESFARATRNTGFKIIPLAYADKAQNNTQRGLNKNYYVLLRQDPETVQMNIPIPFQTLQPGTINNLQFQSAAMGQFTGVIVLRNLEVLYFTF